MISVQTYNRLKSLEIEIQMIGSCLGVLSKSINELPYFVPDQGLEAFERFKTSYQSLHGAYVSLSTHNNISEDNFRGQDETRLNDMHQEVHHVRSELVTLFIATLQWVLSGLKNDEWVEQLETSLRSLHRLDDLANELFSRSDSLRPIQPREIEPCETFRERFSKTMKAVIENINERKEEWLRDLDSERPVVRSNDDHALILLPDEGTAKLLLDLQQEINTLQQNLKTCDLTVWDIMPHLPFSVFSLSYAVSEALSIPLSYAIFPLQYFSPLLYPIRRVSGWINRWMPKTVSQTEKDQDLIFSAHLFVYIRSH